MRHLALVLVLAVAIAGCGGGGDTSGSPTATTPTASRDVPGYRVQVTAIDRPTPGTTAQMQIAVESLEGGATPSAITAWVADTYQATVVGVTADPVPGQTGMFRAAVPVPTVLPGDASVWIRMTFPDGSVLEAGHDAFPVNSL